MLTTQIIEQPATPIFCYLDDKVDSQLTLLSISKAITFKKKLIIVMLKIGKRL